MPLVTYPDSDSDSSSNSSSNSSLQVLQGPRKRPRTTSPPAPAPALLPPPPPPPPDLPAAFLDLYAAAARTSTTDDPSLHNGRVRAVPHVQGNWPAHVYLEFSPSKAHFALLDPLLALLRIPPSASLLSSSTAPKPLHVSLSAPLLLPTPDKAPFLSSLLSSLRSTIAALPRIAAHGRLVVRPRGLAWHPNKERTRRFLVLRLARPDGEPEALAKLLATCNAAARANGCPELYTDDAGAAEDSFHVSLAWELMGGDEKGGGVEDVRVDESVMAKVREMRICFGEVKVKIGKDVTSVPFAGGGDRKRRGGGFLA